MRDLLVHCNNLEIITLNMISMLLCNIIGVGTEQLGHQTLTNDVRKRLLHWKIVNEGIQK